nr:MAG TPA: Repressor protein CI [Caudoviricetes sp.]
MTTWNDRLKIAMKKRGLIAADITRKVGLSGAAVKKWIDGVTLQPKYDDVIRVAGYLQVRPEWLMQGQGEMELASSSCVELELLDMKASCGPGNLNFEDYPAIKKILVTSEWFRRNFAFYNSKTIKMVMADGDSMSPEIEDGDVVFVDISDNINFRDGIYLLLVDGEVFIKRIQRMVGRKIALVSTNKAYRDIELSTDGQIEIKVLGRVVKNMKLQDL